MKQKICIIGLGEIGSSTLIDMIKISKEKNLNFQFSGVDINETTLENLKIKFSSVIFSKEIPLSDIYIILVYSTDQVESVINSIDRKNHPLLIIESTIFPKTAERLKKLWENKKDFDLALFPHRFNPNDPVHRVFNLNRIVGGIDKKSLDRTTQLYSNFMDKSLITEVSFEIAALSKVVENAYRFIEIAIAEDFKMECDRLHIDFNELRKAVNSKWNIDLKEARDGIGGKCLPKDVALLNDFFNENKMIKTAIKRDEEYKKNLKK